MSRLLLPLTAAVVAALGLTIIVLPSSSQASEGTVDCADLGNVVAGTLDANLTVTAHATICTITGTVTGNVSVSDDSAPCAARPPFTAVLVRGTVEGDIRSQGGFCTMIWLSDGAHVAGNVVHSSEGNIAFVGTGSGATVDGNVIVQDGRLGAFTTGNTGTSANQVLGNIICAGGAPSGGPGTGDASNWDGLHADVDGTVSGHYLC